MDVDFLIWVKEDFCHECRNSSDLDLVSNWQFLSQVRLLTKQLIIWARTWHESDIFVSCQIKLCWIAILKQYKMKRFSLSGQKRMYFVFLLFFTGQIFFKSCLLYFWFKYSLITSLLPLFICYLETQPFWDKLRGSFRFECGWCVHKMWSSIRW